MFTASVGTYFSTCFVVAMEKEYSCRLLEPIGHPNPGVENPVASQFQPVCQICPLPKANFPEHTWVASSTVCFVAEVALWGCSTTNSCSPGTVRHKEPRGAPRNLFWSKGQPWTHWRRHQKWTNFQWTKKFLMISHRGIFIIKWRTKSFVIWSVMDWFSNCLHSQN